MLKQKLACALVVLTVASFVWIELGCGQQTPETKSSSPPPPMSFGDSSPLEIGKQPPIISTSNNAQQSDDEKSETGSADADPSAPSARASTYPFGSSKPQTIKPLAPASSYQASVPGSLVEPPMAPAQVKDLDWSTEPPSAAANNSLIANAIPDSQVRPAAHFDYEPPATSVAAQALQIFAIDQRNSAAPGKPISMAEWLGMTGMDGRPEMVRTYWKAFASWARCVSAHAEADQLAELREPNSSIERDMLGTANSMARARILECEMELDAAQHMLVRFSQTPETDLLPLPSDLPLVDEYLTNYAVLAERFGLDSRLSRINQSLPKTLQIIQARAEAATQCRTVVRQAIQACNQNQLPLGSALESIRMCRESHQEFIRAVERYNQDIAEYALAVAPFGQPAEQVVAMLIKSPTSAASTAPTTAPMTANVTPVSRQPQTYPSNAAATGNLEASNSLRTTNSESGRPWNMPTRQDALASPPTRQEFNANASTQFQSGTPRTANVESGNPASSFLSNSTTGAQPAKSTPRSTPPVLQSGGGSFSLGNR